MQSRSNIDGRGFAQFFGMMSGAGFRCVPLVGSFGIALLFLTGLSASTPRLSVSGNHFVDPSGHTVILRGVSSIGMGLVYGDKANPGTYLPMTPSQYIDRAIQTDATGGKWQSRAIRLNFERFPSTNPSRLYATENAPYAMPDTIAFAAWQSNHSYAEGDMVAAGGSRYRVMRKDWRGDRGTAWNPGAYAVGELVAGLNTTHVYRCTSSAGSGTRTSPHWERGPRGTTTWHEDQGDGYVYDWQYIGEFGLSGSTPPSSLTPVSDYTNFGTLQFYLDNLVSWTRVSTDYTPSQAAANFADWKSRVMDPVVQRAIDDGLYVVICEFDFGPAHHPLRHARMADFWHRMATSQWASHPQVLFELFNESETIGSFEGGPGSWAAQKPVLQEIVNGIRSDGASNIIVVPTPLYSAWAGEATASPLAGSNLAYAIHQYRSQWEAYSSNRDQITQALASGQAIVFTEWGDDTGETDPTRQWPDATTVPPTLRALLEPSEGSAHPAAGWFAWSLGYNWFPNLYINTALTQPTPFGVSVRKWLADKQFDSQPIDPTAPSPPQHLRIINGVAASTLPN